MPDDYLDGLEAEDRASMWRRQIDAADGRGLLVVVNDDEVVGFASFGPCQDPGASVEQGQLFAINLDPTHWGRVLAVPSSELRRTNLIVSGS